jgi:murein DD-endopeptidase MepM/ murein hydrolase activator NlpD
MMRWLAFLLAVLSLVPVLVAAPETARTRLADGFDQPVGKPDGKGYYKARGFIANHHMGEDWDGVGGNDFGAPVYAVANGYVVLSRDMRMNWGNLLIIRHAFIENGDIKIVDSVYAHMEKILVREGDQVLRGQQVGAIGTAHGLYPPHLHFEIRKNLAIGFNQREFAKDLSNYYLPTSFIEFHRHLSGAGRSAMVPINTFDMTGGGGSAGNESSRQKSMRFIVEPSQGSNENSGTTAPAHRQFHVNRFEDLQGW